MTCVPRSSLLKDTKGAETLEFALVVGMLMLFLFGGIEASLMLWTRGTLQSVASQTARCAAIGSPLCTNAQSYAVTQATGWLGGALISTGDVTVTTSSTCVKSTSSGITTFEVVTIAASPWVGSIIYPLGSHTETVTACFPI